MQKMYELAFYLAVFTVAGVSSAYAGVVRVPEPSSLALLAAGAVGVFVVRRRRK